MNKPEMYNSYYKLFREKFEQDFPNAKIPNHQEGRHYITIKNENKIGYYCEYTSKGYSYAEYTGFIVGIYLEGETYKNQYQLLLANKDEINNDIGEDLVWLDTGKVGRIFFRLDANIENDVDKWKDIIIWQVNKLKNILKKFPPYINKISTNITFENITRDDILKAITEYDKIKNSGNLNPKRKQIDYILFHNSKEYPHKYIIGIAYGLKNNTDILDSKLYQSTGNIKASASWCLKENGFELYADGKYKKYLENKYQNENTINTYYNDLKKGIKIFQNISSLKTEKLSILIQSMLNQDIDYNIYDTSQKELGFNDKQLFSTLKTKAKEYLESISIKRSITSQKDDEMPTQSTSPLNQILYGPPGTGKTYNTINKALEIIFDKENKTTNRLFNVEIEKETIEVSKSYNDVLELTDNKREYLKGLYDHFNEQISFVTFHQSYGYEEFVEGIKAKTNNNQIKYSVEEGIFKRLCKQAKSRSILEYGQQIGSYQISKINNEYIDLAKKDKSIITIQRMVLNVIFNLIDNKLLTSDDFDSDKARIELNKFDNRIEKSHIHSYRNIYKLFSKYYLDKKNLLNKDRNYILIIDEINRGNISKIFGELITLIEPSKRIGEDEEIRLTLPNSPQERFGVPSNLYIIGTMNTADRSIAQIDTALRRRFEFVEMMPNSDLFTKKNDEISDDTKYIKRDSDLIIKDTEINIRLMINAINERIEYIYDREHTIGHSYFLPLIKTPTKDKLDEIFNVNIIPLLAEYFYGDWGDIVEILNDDKGYFIKEKVLQYKTKNDRQNKVYTINNSFSKEGYLNIYDGLNIKEDLQDNK